MSSPISTDACYESVRYAYTLNQAIQRIIEVITPITESESIALQDALGRVSATAMQAEFPLPPFRNSAMDGYAVRSIDLAVSDRTTFRIAGVSYAGHPFLEDIRPGECVRIFTGAPVPELLDTVIMQEHVEVAQDMIEVIHSPTAGANVRPAGDDAPAGTRLVEAGKRLTPADLGLLASAGHTHVKVVRKLRVAHLSTGDELTALGEDLSFGQIYDSNRYLLRSLLAQGFLEPRDFGIVRDDPAKLSRALREAADWADIVLSSGGVSVGEADFIPKVLGQLGRIDFWKIAFKPGKPFAFGQIGNAWFCGLPGNPVAVLVTFLQLVRPALLRLAGVPHRSPIRLQATSRNALKKTAGRMEFQRGFFTSGANGQLEVVSCGAQGSHRLTGASQANCLIVLTADCTGVFAGDPVEIEPLLETW